MKEKLSPVAVDPEILGGIPVFRGPRVPIKNLFDFLEAGRTTEYFLQQFPTVRKKQVHDVLKLA